ncbi:WbqC family protein [Xenorhabdus sp. PB62.4]|uniref:WbqC family protein n=1 Tax=Xenorhabdus sp. PB62.4 TaxID=1851573 RepID=UPI0016572149|nr:WbqC family protein [Xenorhabdus sp. PB62.4]MBC8953949.1 hypothetical protein [Xenorhabdus sp. PB62.4]
MRISIHQPHYLPWLQLVYKIIISDIFVFLDHVSYSKNDWVNRNKLKNSNGTFILTIPVEKSNGCSIKETRISGNDWRNKHLKSFYYNYNSAKYFDEIFPFLDGIYKRKWTYISEINYEILIWIVDFLKLNVKIIVSSELGLSSLKNDMLIDICKLTNSSEYITGKYSYHNYLDHDLFKANNINIKPIEWKCPIYKQCHNKNGFIPDLSIFDLFMNHGYKSKDILLKSIL